MQMARWFGYRPGYEEICRLYLPQSSLDHYEYIEEAIEELRDEIKRMEKSGQTPEQFGLKVRESPTALRITAANKMRSAKALMLAQDYSERHIEGHVLFNDQNVNADNLREVGRLLEALGPCTSAIGINDPAMARDVTAHRAWLGTDGWRVLDLIRKFQIPAAHGDLGRITADTSLFADYVADRVGQELAKWDVVLPLNGLKNAQRATPFPTLGSLGLRSRTKGTTDERGYHVTGGRNRVADPTDARLLLPADRSPPDTGLSGDRAYCALRDRPLLIIHLFHTGPEPSEKLELSNPVISLSFCLPGTGIKPVERSYQVNKVYQRQLELYATEEDDDEAITNG
jgi:hypothetical protein